MNSTRLLPALLFLLGASCSSVGSNDVKTSGMSASMYVSADSTGNAYVRATLRVGSGSTDYVDLGAGDSLSVKAASTSLPLSRSTALGVIYYDTNFPSVGTGGTLFTISLTRASNTSAPNSSCTMPAGFSIKGPSGGAASRSADLPIVYDMAASSTAGTSVAYSISGDCVIGPSLVAIAADTGSFTIPKGAIKTADASPATASCAVTLTMRRSTKGSLDPAYVYGGLITCEQDRSLTFTSTP